MTKDWKKRSVIKICKKVKIKAPGVALKRIMHTLTEYNMWWWQERLHSGGRVLYEGSVKARLRSYSYLSKMTSRRSSVIFLRMLTYADVCSACRTCRCMHAATCRRWPLDAPPSYSCLSTSTSIVPVVRTDPRSLSINHTHRYTCC